MAEVFLARHRSPMGIEKLVVLKRVLPQFLKNAEHLEMFRDEARIGALLQHSNLVQTFEYGALDGAPFISMEFLHGQDIRGIYRVLRQRGQPMPLELAVAVLGQVAAGLHYAHERVGLDNKPLHIVHRDVSPQNVVVTFEGTVKVVDFGIARAENRLNRTQNAVMKGKVAYMAPEQVMGQPLDRRTDVYALGVMLYEMTTAQRPFSRDNEMATLRAIIDEPLPDPARVVPGYPPELAAIVLKAMARAPAARFQSAQQFQAALDGFARARGFSQSSLMLQTFMRDLFGEQADALGKVLAGTKAVDELEGPGSKSLEDELPSAVVATSVTPQPLPTFQHASLERIGAATVVRFHGKLNERFEGAALGKALAGDVVFDLSRVERVSSYGVREWLAMLDAAEGRVSTLVFVNCPEVAVNQLSMIKRFAGGGTVLSFHAPYRCRTCQQTFQPLLDVPTHAATLARFELPAVDCPTCQRPADFDEDPRGYLAFGPRPPAKPLPADVQRAVTLLSQASTEPVEKLLEGDTTVVRVRAPLDGAIRWRRALDGVEGRLRVDVSQARRFEPEGVEQLVASLQALGPEVLQVVVDGAPRAVLEPLAAAIRSGRVTPGAVLVEGRCATCADARRASAAWSEVVGRVRAGSPLAVSCERCGANLAVDWSWVEATQADPRPAPLPEAPSKPLEPAPPSAPAARGTIAVVFALFAVVGFGLSFWWLSRTAPPPSPQPIPVKVEVEVPPDETWKRSPAFAVTETDVRVLGQGADVEGAEADAMLVLAERLEPQGDVGALFRGLDVAKGTGASVVAQVKRRLAPQREQASAEGGQAWVLLSVSRERFEAEVGAAQRSSVLAGARVILAPPRVEGLPPAGGLLVLSVTPGSKALRAGLRPRDLIVEVDGSPPTSVEGLVAAPGQVKALGGGVTRTLRLR
jgi:serine/threonine protein kinase